MAPAADAVRDDMDLYAPVLVTYAVQFSLAFLRRVSVRRY